MSMSTSTPALTKVRQVASEPICGQLQLRAQPTRGRNGAHRQREVRGSHQIARDEARRGAVTRVQRRGARGPLQSARERRRRRRSTRRGGSRSARRHGPRDAARRARALRVARGNGRGAAVGHEHRRVGQAIKRAARHADLTHGPRDAESTARPHCDEEESSGHGESVVNPCSLLTYAPTRGHAAADVR